MIVYAQPTDLVPDWLPTAPDTAVSLLRYASILVARAAQLSLYDQPPADPAATVLRDATCAQVASWVALKVDPAKAGTDLPGPVKSSTILSAKVDRDTTAANAAAADARDGLCSIATDLLQTAGLLYVPVPLFDNSGYLPHYGLDSPWPHYGPDLAEYPYSASYPRGGDGLLLAELDSRFDNLQETLMAFAPATADPTKVDGPPNTQASSTSSYALPFGRRTVFTGSAVQPVTVATPTVDGTQIEIKVADGSTASVTLPAALQLSGIGTTMTAGQDYAWFWTNSTSSWNIK